MSVDQGGILYDLRELLASYLGRKLSPSDDEKLIGDEIGLLAGDSIQFMDEIEKSYSISLSRLVARRLHESPPSVLRKLTGQSGVKYSDFSLSELAQFIESEMRLR